MITVECIKTTRALKIKEQIKDFNVAILYFKKINPYATDVILFGSVLDLKRLFRAVK